MAANNLELIKKLQVDKLNTLPKAVAYLRVSTKEQTVHGFSLSAQENLLTEYCKKNSLNLAKIYRDEGVSGGVLERSGITQLISELKPNTCILVTELDRLSRNLSHICILKDKIHNVPGCYIQVTNRDLSTKNPSDSLLLNILAVFAENERAVIRSRISLTMRDMSKNGTLRKKPKFGWKYDENKQLTPVEEEQLIIKEIQRLHYDESKNATQIAKILNQEGITLRKSKRCYPMSITRILKANPR
jgi:site-specific DNA recombinase